MRRGRLLSVVLLTTCAVLGAQAAEPDVKALVAKLRTGDLEARQALIQAGIPAIGPLLAHADSPDARFAAEARGALGWIARRVEPAKRPALCKALEPFTSSKEPLGIRRAAIDMLGQAAPEAQVPMLAGLLADRTVREHAAAALARVPGKEATRALVRALRRADAPFRPVLLRHLGSRGDERAARDIARCLGDADATTAVAAADALARIGAAKSEAPLFDALEAARPAVQPALFAACLALGDAHLRRGDAKAARATFTKALARAANANQQVAALAALGRVACPACVDTVRPLLGSTRPEVQRAAYAVVCSVPGDAGSKAVAEALPKAPPALRPMLIRVLGQRRYTPAADALAAAAKDTNEHVAAAALDALRRLAGPAALPTVRMLAEQGRTEPVKLAALRAYLALGQPLIAQGKTEQARALYEHAYALATRDGERIEALNGQAVAGGPALLPTLAPLLKTAKGDVLDAVMDATIAITTRLEASDPKAAVAIYKQAVESNPPLHLAKQMMRRLHAHGEHLDIAGRSGFVSVWWGIGSFEARNYKVAKKPRFPEEKVELKKEYKVGRDTLRWRRITNDDPRGPFDLKSVFPRNDHVLAYAYAELESPTEQDVLVKLGHDDGLTVWLNGTRIYDKMEACCFGADTFKVKARLAKGTNRILAKCANGSGGGGWFFALRLTDPKGTPLRVDQMRTSPK